MNTASQHSVTQPPLGSQPRRSGFAPLSAAGLRTEREREQLEVELQEIKLKQDERDRAQEARHRMHEARDGRRATVIERIWIGIVCSEFLVLLLTIF